MHIEQTNCRLKLANEAQAAQGATTNETKRENTRQIAELRVESNEDHVAAHIRGMVAATIGNLSIQASDATRNDADQWRLWALSVTGAPMHPVAV